MKRIIRKEGIRVTPSKIKKRIEGFKLKAQKFMSQGRLKQVLWLRADIMKSCYDRGADLDDSGRTVIMI